MPPSKEVFQTSKPLPYKDIALRNLSEPLWEAYARGEQPVPKEEAKGGDMIAEFFFYLGDLERGREVSYLYSLAQEQLAANQYEFNKIYTLFKASLYRSLAQQSEEAKKLWEQVVEIRRRLPEDWLLTQHKANYWVQEAYALAKLGRFEEVVEPARKGFEAISQGKGVYEEPQQNSREYSLAGVLEALSEYKLDPKVVSQQKTQQALVEYKLQNMRYGRLGYRVIFDLQFSYPEVFTPILPGPDPDKD